MSRSFISAAERSLIKSCVTNSCAIESLESAPNFTFVPAAMLSDVPTVLSSGAPSKRSVSFKRKPHMRKIRHWSPKAMSWGSDDLLAPMMGDPLELTEARKAYAGGDPGPLREWLAAQTFLAPAPKPAYNRTMGPQEFKAIRQRLGLTQSQLAAKLRIEDLRTIRRYETGERAISGPVSLLMEQIEREDRP